MRKYITRLKGIIDRRTIWVITAICFVGYAVNVAIFYPGFLSSDSLSQWMQAKGDHPITSLHPPVMVFLWRGLWILTGRMSAILLLQLFVFWLGVFLLSVYLYKTYKRKIFAYGVLVVPFLPFVLNISGVIWKDNHLAFSYFLAIVCALWLRRITSRRQRIIVASFATILIVYGTLVRHNAYPALLPLAYLVVHQSRLFARLSRRILATAIILIVTLGIMLSLPRMIGVNDIDIRTGLRYDDLLATTSEEEFNSKTDNTDLERIFTETKACLATRNYVVVGALLACEENEDVTKLITVYNKEIERLWAIFIPAHIDKYVVNRIHVYYDGFLMPVSQYGYVWQDGIINNPYSLTAKNQKLVGATYKYVHNFAYMRFAFLFEPWFWLLLDVVLFIRVWRRRDYVYRGLSLAVLASSVLYIGSYFPSGATNDYRYIYWPVLGTITVITLMVTTHYQMRKTRIRSSKSSSRKQRQK